jgi:hypothetical protein
MFRELLSDRHLMAFFYQMLGVRNSVYLWLNPEFFPANLAVLRNQLPVMPKGYLLGRIQASPT